MKLALKKLKDVTYFHNGSPGPKSQNIHILKYPFPLIKSFYTCFIILYLHKSEQTPKQKQNKIPEVNCTYCVY